MTSLKNVTFTGLTSAILCLSSIAAETTRSASTIHEVASGDNLYAIGKKYSISVAALKKANQLKSDRLQIGQKIIIPNAEGEAPTATEAPKIDPKAPRPEPSETIPEPPLVAPEPKLSDAAAAPIENTKSEAKAVPVFEGKTTPYKIKSGDNFSKIAKANQIPVQKLMEANPGVDARKLQLGQVIQLPDKAAATTDVPRKAVIDESSPSKDPSAPLAETKKQDPSAAPVRAGEKTASNGDPKVSPEQSSPATPKSSTDDQSHPTSKKSKIEIMVLERNMTFEELAKEVGCSIERINELNGHSFPADELFQKGSRFYVERQ